MPILSSITNQIRYINNIPYIIRATFFIELVKDTTPIKEYLNCSTVFKNKKEGVYIFCDEIIEAEEIGVEFDENSV